MARTYFTIMPGVQPPQTFRWGHAPKLIPINDLWDESRKVMSGLVWRIRSNGTAGDSMSAGDHIESCIGIVDSTSRWRASAGIARMMVSSIRNPALSGACWNALGLLMNKHPAAIMTPERQAASTQVREALEGIKGDGAQEHYESSVGATIVRLLFCDNDLDAMGVVPNETSFMVNLRLTGDNKAETVDVDARIGTVEVLSAGILLSESFGRLCERAPDWLWSRLPTLPTAAAAPATQAAESPESSDDEDEE